MEVEQLASYGSYPVVIDANGLTTYAELVELVEKYCAIFESKRVCRGQVVVTRIESGADFLAAFLACQKRALVFAPLTANSSKQRVIEVANALGAEFFLSAGGSLIKLDPSTVSLDSSVKQLHARLFEGGGFVRYTSGTTAAPKGVFVGPRAAAARVHAARQGLNFDSGARVFWPFEMALHFVTVLPVVLESAGCFVVPHSKSSQGIEQAFELSEVEYIYAGPNDYQQLLDARTPKHPIKAAFSTTAPIAGSVRRAFEQSWKTKLRQIYGIFEIGLVAIEHSSFGSGPTEMILLPGIEIDLRDQAGSIYVRSDGLLDAYLSPLRLKHEIATNGWFNSGDLGAKFPNGNLSISGRAAAVIALDRSTVSPEAIEARLCNIDEVRAARVSRISATGLRAELVLRQGVTLDCEDFRRRCPPNLLPENVSISFEQVDTLPMNESGKLMRVAYS